MGGKSGGGATGFKYDLSMLMGLVRGPVDSVVSISVADLPAWGGNCTDNAYFAIDKPDLFGGDKKEGGIVGHISVYMGAPTQTLRAEDTTSLSGGGVVLVPDDILDLNFSGSGSSTGSVGGGDGGGGGGTTTTTDPALLEVTLSGAGLVSAFRGVVTLFYRGQVSVNNPYPKPWKVRMRRALKGWENDDPWYPAKAAIALSSGLDKVNPAVNDIVAMNGAHIIYETATNGVWGRGMDRSLLDANAFQVAADTLFDEGFGLCLRWSRQDTLDSFIQVVIDHIGGATYIDRRTGLLTLKLIRGDYDPTTLPLYTRESGLLDIADNESASSDNVVNEIVIKYHDPTQDLDRSVRAQNAASLQSIGSIISTSVDYPGLPNHALAARVAVRDLKVQSASLKRFVIKLDRRGWRTNPGDVIKISDPSRGLSEIALRVGKVEDGAAGGSGVITLTCIQDIFSFPSLGHVGNQPSLWHAPNTLPRNATRRALQEADYRNLVRNLSAANLAALDPASGGILVMGGRPSEVSVGYELYTKATGEAYADRGSGVWSATARLAANLAIDTVSFTIDRGADWDLIVLGTAALIGGEWVRVDSFDATTGAIVVGRGVSDTLPVVHGEGTYVFFAEGTSMTDRREYVLGETVYVKMLTRTSNALLDIATAPEGSLVIAQRHQRPYPPGYATVEGNAWYAVPILPAADATLAWRHRDRLGQADALIDNTAGSIGPEAGTTYRIRVYDDHTNALLRTTSGITGTAWTYTTAAQDADVAGVRVRIEIESVRDTLVSLYHYNFVVRFNWGGKAAFACVAMATAALTVPIRLAASFTCAATVTAALTVPLVWTVTIASATTATANLTTGIRLAAALADAATVTGFIGIVGPWPAVAAAGGPALVQKAGTRAQGILRPTLPVTATGGNRLVVSHFGHSDFITSPEFFTSIYDGHADETNNGTQAWYYDVPATVQTGAHRYWRLALMSNCGGSSYDMHELQFRNTPGTAHLFSGVTITATQTFSTFGPSNLIDNNTSTEWSSINAAGGQVLTVDYGAGNSYDVQEVQIVAVSTTDTRNVQDMEVQWSDDNTTWHTRWTAYMPLASFWNSGATQVTTNARPKTIPFYISGAEWHTLMVYELSGAGSATITSAHGLATISGSNIVVPGLTARASNVWRLVTIEADNTNTYSVSNDSATMYQVDSNTYGAGNRFGTCLAVSPATAGSLSVPVGGGTITTPVYGVIELSP